MQARAIFEAACDVKKSGIEVKPEIMIPLVGDVNELKLQKDVVDRVAAEVFASCGMSVDYKVGTMIEIPRAALTADEIATVAEFFSFGTNDLTQTTFGMSRDDAGKFLRLYVEQGRARLRPLPAARRAGRGEAHEDRGGAGQKGAAQPQDGHLRRARRRAELGQVLPQAGPQLRELLALPGHGGASGRGPGGDRGKGEERDRLKEYRASRPSPVEEYLLHICCAPCTIYPLKVLRGEGHEATGFFYNPNIHPYTEFQRRREALAAYARVSLLPLIMDEAYDLETFLAAALEAGKERCSACYRIRLERAFQRAVDEKADAVTTTLLYSIYQRHETIAAVGEDLSGRYKVPFLYRDFREGWKEGQDRARSLGIYRQNYCGCIFSEYERFAARPEKSPERDDGRPRQDAHPSRHRHHPDRPGPALCPQDTLHRPPSRRHLREEGQLHLLLPPWHVRCHQHRAEPHLLAVPEVAHGGVAGGSRDESGVGRE